MSRDSRRLDLVKAVQRDLGFARWQSGHSRPANPFEADRVRPGAVAWVNPDGDAAGGEDEVAACLEQAMRTKVGFIVGPHGSGKSTLLRHVVALAEDRGMRAIFLHGRMPVPPVRDLRKLDLVATDVAGRFWPVWWSRLLVGCLRARTPVVGTAHIGLPGLAIHHREPEPAQVRAVIERCLEGTGAAVPPVADVAERLRDADGSVRAVLWSYYDDWEDGLLPVEGWPRRAA
jgi:hypothetical protein